MRSTSFEVIENAAKEVEAVATTLFDLLEALHATAETEQEATAVLDNLLQESRIRFADRARAQAA